jgi:mono/diheme cytochrome c family protein
VCVIGLGCSSEEPPGDGGAGASGPGTGGGSGAGGAASLGVPIPASEQRDGDAAAGYHALVHEGYVGCGVPYTFKPYLFGNVPEEQKLPGREGNNADLPYAYNAFETESGVEVIGPNCLSCHAGVLRGEIVIGLGNHLVDATTDPSPQLQTAVGFVSDPKEKAEMQKFADRMSVVGPYVTPNVGVSNADSFTAALIAHHDRKTLAWSKEPLLPLPPLEVVPVDVPPWWRMAKKNAMFYVAAGRGDHARIMMTVSTACVDSVEAAKKIDAYFPNVRAYIASLEPPAYPFAVDAALAEKGAAVFATHCAACHGTYGKGESYPNLLVPTEVVGTDELLAVGATFYAGDYVTWYEESFYGEIADIVPGNGYVAPPLDGIWATAPFLHNGSVPTLAALLDSTTRPKFWRRKSQDGDGYDEAALGWSHDVLSAGHDAEPNAEQRKLIYDTTRAGYSNKGHTFGDALGAADRAALLEYLKTL